MSPTSVGLYAVMGHHNYNYVCTVMDLDEQISYTLCSGKYCDENTVTYTHGHVSISWYVSGRLELNTAESTMRLFHGI